MDLNASSRVHGFNAQNKTYATGSTGMVAIAIQAADVELGATGVVATLEAFKRQFGITSSTTYLDATYAVYQDDVQTGYDYYIPAESRTFIGVASDGSVGTTATIGATDAPVAAGAGADTADAAYVRAYYAQENIRKIIDTLQQRAVLLGVSQIGAIADTTALTVADGWSSEIADAATSLVTTYLITFVIEKINSIDGTTADSYGKPLSVTTGAGLLADLANVSLYDSTGTLVPLTTANSSIKVGGLFGAAV